MITKEAKGLGTLLAFFGVVLMATDWVLIGGLMFLLGAFVFLFSE